MSCYVVEGVGLFCCSSIFCKPHSRCTAAVVDAEKRGRSHLDGQRVASA